MKIDWSALLQKVTSVGIQVLVALVIMFISFKVINFLGKKLEKKLLASKHADKTLSKSILYICKTALKILVVICLIGYLGIDTSGLSALIASLGVCVGLAVNGTLSNLAGGVMLLITRPFKVDDYIEAAGFAGTVEDIHIVTTSIRTLDNKLIFIPNGTLSTTNIVNYSTKATRRVDIDFSVAYGADFELAEKIILAKCLSHELVLKDPEPFARVTKQAESSIVITMRAWTENANYWTVYFDLIEGIKKEFDARGIEIPFPQMDIHVKH